MSSKDGPNTVWDISVSFNFFSKTLGRLVAKNGSKQVNNTDIVFFDSLADVCANVNKYKKAFKIIVFLYL